MPVQQTMSGDWYQSRPKGWPRHGWEKRLGAILFGALVMFVFSAWRFMGPPEAGGLSGWQRFYVPHYVANQAALLPKMRVLYTVDRSGREQPLSFRSQHSRLVPIRVWFRWMARQRLILHNPANELELPRLGHRLPKHVLNTSEAEKVIAQPDINDPLGLRDRALLETLYSTGMRRLELANLKLYDLDTERGTLTIRQGKGKKDRVIPIGDRAAAWIDKYVSDSRPHLVNEPDDNTVFLSNAGEPMSLDYLTQLVATHVDAAQIGKRGACHLFRHTMATLMLENGADIRYIQAMLGHADLKTTQIYTQVSIRHLKQIHTATHPAQLPKKDGAATETAKPDTAAREELLNALAAEQDEEAEQEP